MSDSALLEQIADQAKTVRRLQREYWKQRTGTSTPLFRDCKAAEAHLDRLLARRAGVPEQEPLFAEGARG